MINYIARKKKPIILSTGMASIREIENAIKIIEKISQKIVILHCVSNYPTKNARYEFKKIDMFKKKFKKNII